MDWSKAKTIFIITFFILDLFLLYQIYIQKYENRYDLIKETSIEEQLAADNIKVKDLPDEPTKASYVEADSKQFKVEDFAKVVDQEVSISNNTQIFSVLDTPYPLGEDWKQEDVDRFVHTNVQYGTYYVFWEHDAEKNTITYYQTYNGKIFYENKDAQVELQLNENNEIISYSQTALENIQEIKEQEIITAHDAMVVLYNKNHLKTGYEISNVDLGYYTLVPIMSSQLLAPTWRFTINGDTDLFVNAVEGYVFQVQDRGSQVLE